MIKKAGSMRCAKNANMRGGNGVVEMLHFLEQDESFGTGRLFSLTTMPPGASIGTHKHEGEFEIYYILDGTAHVMDNDTPGVLEAGDCMVCLDGDSHSIENRGETEVKALFLIIKSR